jgi:predicted NBD/HSP70 family sugar kinase
VLDEAGDHVGRVIGIALNLFGPELVVLGGPRCAVTGFSWMPCAGS